MLSVALHVGRSCSQFYSTTFFLPCSGGVWFLSLFFLKTLSLKLAILLHFRERFHRRRLVKYICVCTYINLYVYIYDWRYVCKGAASYHVSSGLFFNSEPAGNAYTFTQLRLTREQNYYNIYVYLHLHSRELAAYYSMKLNKLHFCWIYVLYLFVSQVVSKLRRWHFFHLLTAPFLFIHQISFQKKPVSGEEQADEIMHTWTSTLQESVRLVNLPRLEW